MKIPFKAGNILIPKKNIDMHKWSVVACDQYTSEPEYWKEVANIVETSTIKNSGIEELKEKIKELFNIEEIKTKDYTYLSNSRQISLAKKAYKELKQAEEALENKVPIDLVEIDLKDAFDTLGEIIGETYSDEIIDNLFKNFCVGK